MLQPGPRMTLVFLHHLGGSAETWKPVEDRLSSRFACLRLDLPGFGAASAADGLSVAGMADWVQSHVAERVHGAWILVGHSMSAKVALLIARRHADATSMRPALVRPLVGLVLAAGSPPAPEPMDDAKRRDMLGWFAGDAAQSRREADGFVRANASGSLQPDLHENAIQDVLRTGRPAWRAWLEGGSLEDLRDQIGVVSLPALVLAGQDDEALGHEVQREQMLPHLASGRLEIVDGAAHLLPMEQPDRVAALIAGFAGGLDSGGPFGRMTRRTMALLRARGRSDDAYVPTVLDDSALAVLRRLVRHVLPMPDGIEIDLAARLDAKLADAVGDGWRFASLPPDQDAYRRALAALDASARRNHGIGFAALDDAGVALVVDKLADGCLEVGNGFLSAKALADWFGEVRGDCCQIFLTHPSVQARADILAAATGNDAELRGFSMLEAGNGEPWERTVWQERA